MSLPRATVNKLLTWSTVDGPGNRLVLFLQGCNFACAACHNPYTIGVCDHCGDCVPACKDGALKMVDGWVVFDLACCTHCDDCLTACPISSSPMVQEMGVEDVLAVARKHRHFLTGITLSGGEATMQLKFTQALFQALADDAELAHLTRFIDSNGHLGAKGWQSLLPVTDGVMLDIKGFEPTRHRDMTGQSHDRTLRAAKLLHDAGKLYELRFLLIPGQTDGDDEVTALIRFVTGLDPAIRIRLNAFQHHGVHGRALDWPVMARDGVEAVAERLRTAGIVNITTPVLYQ